MVMQIKLAVVERFPASDHLAYLQTHLLAIKTCIFFIIFVYFRGFSI